MLDKFLGSTVNVAATTFSVVNALHFGVLKKMGFLKEATTSFTEIQGSDEPYNLRLDNNHNVQFQFHVNSEAYLGEFFDPTSEEHFLKWHFVEGSYVTLPGIAENAEISNGRLALKTLDTLEYSFEFLGKDGEEYVYKGKKKFSFLNPVKSWSSLKGSVYDKETGEVILESITFFGNGDIASSLLPFISSIKID